MVWLVINDQGQLYGSQEEGLAALTQTLANRHARGCTITPDQPATHGVQYHVQHPSDGFETIHLSDEEPESQD